jgi:cytosine/adenosine deaminase-related metal-dependent hydrolase
MILRARSVVTMDGAPIANGAVAINGGTIASVGAWDEIAQHQTGDVVDLGEVALMPGLINAHCHFDYTDLRGVIPPPTSFTGWVQAINAQKARWTEDDYLRSIRAGYAEAASFGTTTVVNLAAVPQLQSKLRHLSLRTWWLAEMIDVRERVSPAEVLRSLRSPAGLAPHAPYTASASLYAQSAALSGRRDLLLTTHIAESREEMQMFAAAAGPLFEFMKEIGRPMDDCGSRTPLAYLLSLGVLDDRWIVAHLNELIETDFAALEYAPRFHIAHCPRSHAYFGNTPFAFARLKALGFNICIATDSLASNEDLSLFAELRQFRKNEALSARDLLDMVTVNPAAALGQGDALGRVRAGFVADLIAVPASGGAENLYDDIVEFRGRIPWSMIGGSTM